MKKTLDSLNVGMPAKIFDLTGKPESVSRATAMGFCPGVGITVLRNVKGYPLIVHLNDTQIVIDKAEAKKVVVDEYI